MSHDDWADYLDPGTADPRLDDLDRDLLDRTRRVLRDDATWDQPSPTLEQRILAQARHTPQQSTATAAPSVTPRAAARRRRARWQSAAAVVAAAAAAVIAIVALNGDDTAVPTEQYALAGTALASQATAEAEIESRSAGDAITLNITGLPPAPAGSYYAAWVSGPRGTVGVGTFHWRKGGIPIELWSGVDTQRYPRFSVTLQREGAPPEMSDQVFLRGLLRP